MLSNNQNTKKSLVKTRLWKWSGLEDKNNRCSGCFYRKRRSFLVEQKRYKPFAVKLENK